MNIFVLSRRPDMCATFHCDKHVVKMATEYAQILATAARAMGYEHGGYASTHQKHPCTVWAASKAEHWAWLYRLAHYLGVEYTRRYGKTHAATSALAQLPPELTAMAQACERRPKSWVFCVPDDCLQSDIVEAYRTCYRRHKARFATWKAPSIVPAWFCHEPT